MDRGAKENGAAAEVPGIQIEVPLRSNFRFVHEPIHSRVAERFVGRLSELEELVQRIRFSDGGSFLITGYRGVGKTSFVNQVLSRLERETLLLDVQINLARPIKPGHLMHLIVRSLYDRLMEKDLFKLLSAELQVRLSLAYQRTSANLVRKLSDLRELGFETGEMKFAEHVLPFAPKISAKRSRTVDLETSFLAYDDKAAEHDIVYLSRELAQGVTLRAGWGRAAMDRLFKRPARMQSLKIVFVFDEMDKLEELTAENPERNAVDELLASLKNLFTTSGICFVFVAGKELHERWLNDMWRGDSIYESVFAYDKYLSCMWEDVDALCGQLTSLEAESAKGGGSPQYTVYLKFKNYLRFKGRGIPRRILRSFNEMVRWRGGNPVLAFTNEDLRRVTFFADLNLLLDTHGTRLFGRSSDDTAGTRQDRRRLGVYYLIDWILRQGESEFTVSDLLNASRHLSSRIALAEEVAGGAVNELLDVLIGGEYIQEANRRLDDVAIGGDAAAEQKRYRLTPRRLAEIRGVTTALEEEGAGFPASAASARTKLGRYELAEEIGRGGMANVYRAWDTERKIFVALKVLHRWLAANPTSRERFRRESEECKGLKHESIVQIYDSGEIDDQSFIAMELVDGLDLAAILGATDKLACGAAVGILQPVASAAHYCHEQGLVRLDIKPQNILVGSTGHVWLTDFGIARKAAVEAPITLVGQLVGTPRYMSPEQVTGNPIDRRSDIFAFGVVLYEALTGQRPFPGEDEVSTMRSILSTTPAWPSTLAPVPTPVDALVMRCIEKDPSKRYPTMAEVASALTPWLDSNSAELVGGLVGNTRSRTAVKVQRARTLMEEPKTKVGFLAQKPPVPPIPPPMPAPVQAARQETPRGKASSAITRETIPPLVVKGPSEATKAAGAVQATIRLVNPKSGEVAWESIANFGTIMIGRAPECEVRLNNEPAISQYHARIGRTGEVFVLMDLNSSNGTYVNGARILDPVKITNGDVIRVGKTELRFEESPAGPVTR